MLPRCRFKHQGSLQVEVSSVANMANPDLGVPEKNEVALNKAQTRVHCDHVQPELLVSV